MVAAKPILRVELSANLVLAAPKQGTAQKTLGVGPGSTSESRIARLAYIKSELDFLVPQLKDVLEIPVDLYVPRYALLSKSISRAHPREGQASKGRMLERHHCPHGNGSKAR